MTDLLNQLNQTLFGPGLTVAVFSAGLFLFFLVGRFPLFHPKQTLRALTEPSKDGISPLKAMTVALAGTLGVGNIAGVASAIAVGGAGAVFWMWLSAFAAMPIKYAETLLAVRHRRLRNKQMHGGAFFYMEDRRGKLFSFAALVFAILCLTAALTMGCMVQSNAVAISFSDTFSLSPRFVALSLGVLTFAVVSGGLSQISSLTVRLIPAMSALYLILSLFILFTHPAEWGRAFGEIFTEAFSKKAVGGGLLGFLSSNALRLGVTRGIFSSEAGCGTAPIVHASANVDHPARQGLFGMLEVFFDTVVMCSLTAFVVLIAKDGGLSLPADGMSAASLSFGKFLPFAPKLLAVAVFVFAFCSIVCWFYYGSESLSYLASRLGLSTLPSKIYPLLYALCTAAGCLLSGGIVWEISDLSVSLMTLLNVSFLLLSSPEILGQTRGFFLHKNIDKT